jgi:hypothetical protein
MLVLASMALLWAIGSGLWAIAPSLSKVIGGLLVIPGFYFAFALVHVLGFCGLVGVVLWASGEAIDPKLTIITAILGLLVAAPPLVGAYLNVHLFQFFH